jgi:pimeloyl-ACP methyl ester carboxylesterase/class 3 adenylate cyclase
MGVPETRYARSVSGDSIAYQVIGDGPLDLLFVPGFVSNLEVFRAEPAIARFYERLASFSRLILLDKRGTGLSDPLPGPQTLEERIEDVQTVMDAVGSDRAALLGLSEGAAMAMVYAAAYPDRTAALVLCGAIVGGGVDEHPAGDRWADAVRRIEDAARGWGDGATMALLAPDTDATAQQLGAFERAGASPRMARELIAMWLQTDVRGVLPSITVPTLLLHRRDEIFPVEAAREIAAEIPGAKLVELPGRDHMPWFGDAEAYVSEIEEFLTGTRARGPADRVLATVLMTDIVGSTARAAALGDAAWRDVVARHDDFVRSQLRRFDGREVKQTGDGFLATFDGPARAILCARAIVEAAPDELGIGVRAGIHTGEVEIVGADLRGVAVHIAARVCAQAGAGEVLVSSTVKELVLGSGLEFADRGGHSLKGVPGEWRLYAVQPGHVAAGAGGRDS